MEEQNNKTKIEEVLEIVQFLKDNGATQESVQESVNSLEGRLNKRIDSLEAKMVTKDFLIDKLGDLRGDLVVLMRKEDGKLRLLVEKLHQRKILSDADKEEIFQMEPFPQLML